MEQIGRMIKIICFGLIKFDLSAHIHNVAQKSTDTDTYALCRYTYMKLRNRPNYSGNWNSGNLWKGNAYCEKNIQETSGVLEIFYILISVMII